MTQTTVAELASELKKSTNVLLQQLQAAGVSKQGEQDVLTDADKQKLLGYLQASHGTGSGERKKITLVKKSTTEIKQADATGKARTIQVEVRKKRTFIQRDEAEGASKSAETEAPPSPVIDQAELARREEEARRQAELIRRQEEELAEKRRLREEQEARDRALVQEQEAQRAAQTQSEDRPGGDAAAPIPADEARAQADAQAQRVQAERAAQERQAKAAAEAKEIGRAHV